MSKQTKITFTKREDAGGGGDGGGGGGEKRKRAPTYAQQNLAELVLLFTQPAAAAASSSSSSSSSSSFSSSSAAASSSGTSSTDSGVICLSEADVRACYHARQGDMQKTIDALVESTGRHEHMHSRFVADSGAASSHSSSSSTEGSLQASPSLKKQRSGGLVFEQKAGDLFGCEGGSALVHCVSVDLAMGKGIAVLFKNRFGGLAELKAQKKQVGEVAVLQREGRWIYYLITKPRYFDKPTYGSLESSLVAMRAHMLQHRVRLVSMPRIGCGLDGLLWAKVADLIKRVFYDDQVRIVVYTI